MADVIEWKSVAEIIEILEQQNAMVAGMSVSEAAAALGFAKTASGIYVKTIVNTTATAVTSTTASAAASGIAGASTSAGNLVLYESASGGAAVGGLASVVAPVALCTGAAVGGYLIGGKIYEKHEDFLDKLMFPIYDFFTGQNMADRLYDTYVPTVPMIYDRYGNCYMDSKFVGKVIEVMDSMSPTPVNPIIVSDAGLTGHQVASIIGITNSYDIEFLDKQVLKIPDVIVGYNEYHNRYAVGRLAYDIDYFVLDGNRLQGYTFHKNTNTYGRNESCDRSLWGNILIAQLDNNGVVTNVRRLNNSATDIDFIIAISKPSRIFNSYEDMVNRVPLTQPDNYYPAEVVKYTPGESQVSPITFPDEIPQWVPVALPEPVTVPGTMPEPKEYPDTSPNPEKITPFINPIQPQPDNVPIKKPDPDFKPSTPVVPVPNPIPDTSTEPVPSPDASKDPSQGLKPITPPEQVPTSIPQPNDTGETPKPVLPIVPPITSEATGLLHVYNPTNSQINEFGSWLWTTFSGDLMETLSKLFNNPMDAVIGLHEIYCTPSVGEESTIKAGFLDSEVASRLVSSRYVNIDCGAIGVPEYWHNYLDYAPYTKTYCYLPFIGIVELNTDDIVGSGVEISYKIDTYNGSCIAIITTAKPGSPESITYQFSGNCAVEVPITSGMKSATQGALLGAVVTGFASAAVTGGGGAVLGASAVGGLRGASNSKNSVQHSGSFGSSYGAMGLKKPYLMIKRPKQKVVYGYNENYGYPAHKMVHIAKCSGYLKAIEVDVISPTATEDEKKLIEQQLKSGIFVD